jgi:hypothetical protein
MARRPSWPTTISSHCNERDEGVRLSWREGGGKHCIRVSGMPCLLCLAVYVSMPESRDH